MPGVRKQVDGAMAQGEAAPDKAGRSGKIGVLLVDDHVILRESIRSLLQDEPDIVVVGEAGDGEAAVAEVERTMPDVALMDISMPRLNGLEATRRIKQSHPEIKVLILTIYETGQYLGEMLRVGASGYLVKTATADELVSAIRWVNRGDVYLYPSIARMLVEDYMEKVPLTEDENKGEGLTRREREILAYIACCKKNKAIADLLDISVRTVQAHRANLMEKLGVHDRTELVKYAMRKGIIEP
jgi:two-component system, NarL family, response regulator NreC